MLAGPSVPSWSPSEMTTSLVASEVPVEFSAQLEASCLTNSGFWVTRPLPMAPSPSAFVLRQQECDQKPTHGQSHSLAIGWPPNTLHLSSSPAQLPHIPASSPALFSGGPRFLPLKCPQLLVWARRTGAIFPKGWGSLPGCCCCAMPSTRLHGNLFEVRDHSWFIFYCL